MCINILIDAITFQSTRLAKVGRLAKKDLQLRLASQTIYNLKRRLTRLLKQPTNLPNARSIGSSSSSTVHVNQQCKRNASLIVEDPRDPNANLKLARKRRESAKSKCPSHFTDQSRMALAVRRNLSNAAASDMGSVLLEDIATNTVIAAENMLAATLVARSRSFHESQEMQLRRSARSAQQQRATCDSDDGDDAGVVDLNDFQFVIHAFRSDATSSNVWQNSKLQAADVLSVYLTSTIGIASASGSGDQVWPGMSTQHGWCDLQRACDTSAVGGLCASGLRSMLGPLGPM